MYSVVVVVRKRVCSTSTLVVSLMRESNHPQAKNKIPRAIMHPSKPTAACHDRSVLASTMTQRICIMMTTMLPRLSGTLLPLFA